MALTQIPQGSGRGQVEVKLRDKDGNIIAPGGFDTVRLNIIDITGQVKTEYKNPTEQGYEPLNLQSDGVGLDLLASETANYAVGTIFFDIWLDDSSDTTPLAFPRTELAEITKSTI